MCGIVAYVGYKPATPLLLEGLKRMEYRGYDSAGVAVMNGGLQVAKSVGRVRVLEEMLETIGRIESGELQLAPAGAGT